MCLQESASLKILIERKGQVRIDSYNAHVTGLACEARYIFMKNENIELQNQSGEEKELSIFEGKKPNLDFLKSLVSYSLTFY